MHKRVVEVVFFVLTDCRLLTEVNPEALDGLNPFSLPLFRISGLLIESHNYCTISYIFTLYEY